MKAIRSLLIGRRPQGVARAERILVVGLALFGLVFAWGVLIVFAAPGLQTTPSGDGPVRRETSGDPNAPLISFIDSPTATCYRPVAGTGACYVQWNYLGVSAPSSYVISMTVAIDGHYRANISGFFQDSMYVGAGQYAPGFKVTCGLPGASGIPNMGYTYSYVIRAKESGGNTSANYGSVTCPADTVRIFLPVVKK